MAAKGYNVVAYRSEAQRIAAKLEFAKVYARAGIFACPQATFSQAGVYTTGPRQEKRHVSYKGWVFASEQ